MTVEQITAPSSRAVKLATHIRDRFAGWQDKYPVAAPSTVSISAYNEVVSSLFETLPEGTLDAREAYRSFIGELIVQYSHLVAAGFTFTFHDEDPTPVDENGKISSGLLLREIDTTLTVRIYRSEPGFHALLDDVVHLPDGQHETANTLFRAVHDALGHAATGASFSQKGETIAYYSHARTFTPLARVALFNEAVAQQAYYAVHGDYSPQRTPVIPSELYNPPLA